MANFLENERIICRPPFITLQFQNSEKIIKKNTGKQRLHQSAP